MNVITDCKSNYMILLILISDIGKTIIDKDSKNVDFLEKLEKNIMNAKVRNVIDVEYNKKF